jgi:hypothetical protein
MFHAAFAQDVNTTKADIIATAQKPFNQSIFTEPSASDLETIQDTVSSL